MGAILRNRSPEGRGQAICPGSPRKPALLRHAWVFGILILTLVVPLGAVNGQTSQPQGPYYVIQAGDSLWSISAWFGVSVEALEQANQIGDADQISPGEKLVIPGIQGYSGELSVGTVGYGEDLRSLSRKYAVPVETLVQMNRITSPNQLFVGASLLVPAEGVSSGSAGAIQVAPGESVLELAALKGITPWDLAGVNNLSTPANAVAGEVLALPGNGTKAPSSLPPEITAVEVDPAPLLQGKTSLIRVESDPGLLITGRLASYPLNFFPAAGGYVALQGIQAQFEPGLYPLSLKISLPAQGGEAALEIVYSQSVLIGSANYAEDPPLTVDPATLDPAVTVPEDKLWASLGTAVTVQKMWEGLFQSPVPVELKDCWTSLFGNHRTYNGGVFSSYHSGLDFCGTVGTPLTAVASGKVVYTGSLKVRGNVTVIDHGWGVYTAYDHQSEILVKPGDQVTPGQVIGLGGATGRSTGPHLHWEVWVGGVPVDPEDWLKRSYP